MSVTSINSISSTFVSSENGVPFVSEAQESKPSLDKYAPCGGVKKTPRLEFGPWCG